jgi:uncharacterized protein
LIVIGVDLAGPSNVADSACFVFHAENGRLDLLQHLSTLSDTDFCQLLQSYSSQQSVVIGLDAPLSYQPGGGDRPADYALRKQLVESGLKSGTVMTPTLTKMVYLTVRGLTIARLAQFTLPQSRIVEVHPAGAMALRGASISDIRELKKSPESRYILRDWLGSMGLHGLDRTVEWRDHDVAAAAAALAAWKWSLNQSKWLWPAEPPFHPYDFAC